MENDPDQRLIAHGRLAGRLKDRRFKLAALNRKPSPADVIASCLEALSECGRRITISPKLNLSEKVTLLNSLKVESIMLLRKVLDRAEVSPVVSRIHDFSRTQAEEARTIALYPDDPFVTVTQRGYWISQYQHHHRFGRGDAALKIGIRRTDITEWIRHRNRKKSKIEPALLRYRTLEDLQEIPDVESILAQCSAIAKFIEVQAVTVADCFPEEAAAFQRAARFHAEQGQLDLLEEAASPDDQFASRRQRELAMRAGLDDPEMGPALEEIDTSDRNAWKRDRSKRAYAIEDILGKPGATGKAQEYRLMFRSSWKTPKGPADRP